MMQSDIEDNNDLRKNIRAEPSMMGKGLIELESANWRISLMAEQEQI